MSILKYFTANSLPTHKETGIGKSATKEANQAVKRVLAEATSDEPTAKKKRKAYTAFTDHQRAAVGKYAAQCGNAAAVCKFKTELPDLGESTVRLFKKRYLEQLSASPGAEVDRIGSRKRGRPLTLGDIDEDVQKFITALRKSGTPVNTPVILAAAEGIVKSKDRTLLAENGGHIKLTKSWAISLMQRMNFVMRRGSTKAKTNLSEEQFTHVKQNYFSKIVKLVRDNRVPPQLVINWDQTGINIVPASSWTMEEEGSKTVPIVGLGDKRQITATVAVAMTGEMLPMQVLYAGKTERCHPQYKFPAGFDIWHTPNHWANTETTIRLISEVIVPYVNAVRERMELSPNHPAIVIFDAFRGHKTDDVASLLAEKHLMPVLVPNNCTDQLQPIDVSVNKPLKDHLRKKFTAWYAEQVKDQLGRGGQLEDVKVDLRLSIMKELEAMCMVSAYDYIKSNKTIIQNGFVRTGIVDAIEGKLDQRTGLGLVQDEDPFSDLDD